MEYEKEYDYIVRGSIIPFLSTWYEQGRRKKIFFFNSENSNKKKSCVRKLLRWRRHHRCQCHIKGNLYFLFRSLWQKTTDSNWLHRLSLWSELLNSFLSKWCHERDVHAKVYLQFLNVFMFSRRTFQNNKAPGNDGLSAEFYKFVWPEIGNLLVESLNNSYIHGELSTSQKEALINLTEKKDKDDVSRKRRR